MRRATRIYLFAAGCFLLAGCDSCHRSQDASLPPGPSAAPSASASQSASPDASSLSDAEPWDAAAATGVVRELTWTYESTPVGPMSVVVVVPSHASPTHKLPVLVTMHGRGEAFKGPKWGARGWVDDYRLPRAIRRLHTPPLTPQDFLSFTEKARLASINEGLAKDPYRGVVVVCPYTPDILAGDRPFDAARPLAAFLVDQLLPRVARETPAIGTPETTGIDGVSLGGRAAVLVGLERPEAFGALGALQAAFDSADAPKLATRAEEAMKKNPKLRIRLLTSAGDFYLQSNRAISEALSKADVEHTLLVVPGPHDYAFNRGPGAFEMLLFHDRALRGKEPI